MPVPFRKRANKQSHTNATRSTSTRPPLPFSAPLTNKSVLPLHEGRLTTLYTLQTNSRVLYSSPDMGLVVEARRNKASVLRAVGEGVHTLNAQGS